MGEQLLTLTIVIMVQQSMKTQVIKLKFFFILTFDPHVSICYFVTWPKVLTFAPRYNSTNQLEQIKASKTFLVVQWVIIIGFANHINIMPKPLYSTLHFEYNLEGDIVCMKQLYFLKSTMIYMFLYTWILKGYCSPSTLSWVLYMKIVMRLYYLGPMESHFS